MYITSDHDNLHKYYILGDNPGDGVLLSFHFPSLPWLHIELPVNDVA